MLFQVNLMPQTVDIEQDVYNDSGESNEHDNIE